MTAGPAAVSPPATTAVTSAVVDDMFVPVPYSRPEGAAMPPAAALMQGAFPPMGPPPPGGPVGPVPLVIAPGFPPGAPGPLPVIEREPVDVCKLFVGGLNPSTTDAELEEYFKQYGAVSTRPTHPTGLNAAAATAGETTAAYGDDDGDQLLTRGEAVACLLLLRWRCLGLEAQRHPKAAGPRASCGGPTPEPNL